MTVTASSFRLAFPEFANTSAYPDPRVDFWLSLSVNMFNVDRWGAMLDHGMMLLVAHNLALGARSLKDAEFGKTPGQASGPVNNKSVDKVSIGYDTTSATEENAGAYNLTIYGQQYIRLARLIGAGPVQVDVPTPGSSQSLYSGLPYTGPY